MGPPWSPSQVSFQILCMKVSFVFTKIMGKLCKINPDIFLFYFPNLHPLLTLSLAYWREKKIWTRHELRIALPSPFLWHHHCHCNSMARPERQHTKKTGYSMDPCSQRFLRMTWASFFIRRKPWTTQKAELVGTISIPLTSCIYLGTSLGLLVLQSIVASECLAHWVQ